MSLYTIRVQNEFCAAHVLHGHTGECGRLHGHNWTVETVLCANTVNEIGLAYDFKDLKAIVKELISLVDHRYLNEVPPFDKINPSAENVAKWFYQQLSEKINNDQVFIKEITIWETNRSAVTYTEHV